MTKYDTGSVELNRQGGERERTLCHWETTDYGHRIKETKHRVLIRSYPDRPVTDVVHQIQRWDEDSWQDVELEEVE